MDASLKETEYDVLLVGTGMVEGFSQGTCNKRLSTA